eukprot:TRINITY_DN8499_c0_g1_i3.p1 TRINITY_DN8499_c0_g1~~TRINITY_DN8499_c0_g1_i3.p1  ORF type:complete len:515 (-),score=47.29 TRINITY_DN8499_c0_g1_i3:85-1629(-)
MSFVSRMRHFQVADSELLRGTPAKFPLRYCGAALRRRTRLNPPSTTNKRVDEGNSSDDFHARSRAVKTINQFWSHSWADAGWLKVVILLVECNGLAAGVAGTLAAFVVSALVVAGALPVMGTISFYDKEASLTPWSLSAGVLCFVLTLLFWPSGQLVFLDTICISQVNTKRQLDGVRSIGAFLKASQSMLVLLDSTYVTRLWCVFEIAAYSKLMDDFPDKQMQFKPLPQGSMFIFWFLACTLHAYLMIMDHAIVEFHPINIVLSFLMRVAFFHSMRHYQHVMAKLRGQLKEFTMDASRCFCCTVGHVHPETRAQLLCDRDAVYPCVEAWFGSSEAFQNFVQHSLCDKFVTGITREVLPYKIIVMSDLPLVWTSLDVMAGLVRQGQWAYAADVAFVKAIWTFTFTPLWFAFFNAICHVVGYTSRRCLTSRCGNACVSVCVTIVCSAAVSLWSAALPNSFMNGGFWAFSVLVFLSVFATCWIYCDCVRRCSFAAYAYASTTLVQSRSRAGTELIEM